MRTQEFWDFVLNVKGISGADKRTEVFDFIDESDPDVRTPIVSLLIGSLDDLGISKKTIRKAVHQSQIPLTQDELSELESETGSITESLMEMYSLGDSISDGSGMATSLQAYQTTSMDENLYGDQDLLTFYNDVLDLKESSGNQLLEDVIDLFSTYYPPLVVMSTNPKDFSSSVKGKSVRRAFGEQIYDSLDDVFRLREISPITGEFVER
jgi:hypothetical protein